VPDIGWSVMDVDFARDYAQSGALVFATSQVVQV
jgi:hypothetical protein